MFASIVEYRLNPIFKSDFMRYWQAYIDALKHSGALERAYLHSETPIALVAYFQWKGRQSFEQCFLDPSPEYAQVLRKIEDTCNDVKVLHRMDIILDQ